MMEALVTINKLTEGYLIEYGKFTLFRQTLSEVMDVLLPIMKQRDDYLNTTVFFEKGKV